MKLFRQLHPAIPIPVIRSGQGNGKQHSIETFVGALLHASVRTHIFWLSPQNINAHVAQKRGCDSQGAAVSSPPFL
jgi:imidazole glycerol phosphate synthase subunit HisF